MPPGFHLHTSNRLEALVDRLVASVREPAGDPLDPETIVLQSAGMERWLKLQIASRLGACANCDFIFPQQFVWQLFRRLNASVPRDPPHAPEVLAWRVFRLLPQMASRAGFEAVRNYLRNDGDGRKQFQLAHRLGDLFDQYFVYRPEMILRWDKGGVPDDATERWQRELWRALRDEAGDAHPARLREMAFNFFRAPGRGVPLLPRLAIFGISALPPFYVELFKALALRCEVNLFLLQPTDQFWADAQSPRERLRVLGAAPRGSGADLHLDRGHPLVGSLGALGRDFLSVLIEGTDFSPEENFIEPEGKCLLHRLQADIFKLREPAGDGEKRRLNPQDGSLQIHNCHSPLRELEVLRDRLLDCFRQSRERGEELHPRDIMVMMPDIETYAPLVQAVFGATESGVPLIPFSVADRGGSRESHVIATFVSLLNLTGTRLGAASVLGLLESAAVRDRFDLEESDLPLLRGWIEDAGIRWGRDGAHRESLGLPAVAQNTWRAGLDRLLLGYAMRGRGERIVGGVLPCDGIEGKVAETLGRFAGFVEKLFAALDELGRARPVAEWADLLIGVLDDFFSPDESAEADAQRIRSALARLKKSAHGTSSPVSLAVIVEALTPALEENSVHSGFLSGRVTFGALKPMRSIPFKIICLLGMNDGAFPRTDPRSGFDLMARAPRLGDRSMREDDRYLFLETILSARERLHVSYTGQSIRDNSPAPPSVLVSELLDCVRAGSSASDGGGVENQICFQHPLQAFNPGYFRPGARLFSYSADNFAACEALRQPRRARGFCEQPLAPLASDEWRTVGVDELAEFFANPPRYFALRRLGLQLARAEAALEEREPFEIAGLTRFRLRQQVLDAALAGVGRAASLERLRAAGSLPPGRAGEAEFSRLAEDMEPVAAAVATLGAGELREPVEVNLQLADFRITGWIVGARQNGLLQFRAGEIAARDLVRAWVRHLVWNALPGGQEGRVSFVVGSDGKGEADVQQFRPVSDAAARLADLLKLYEQGQREPLKFFPESALAMLKPSRSKKDPRDRARESWRGGEWKRGECRDEYHDLFFRNAEPIDDEFVRVAGIIIPSLLEHSGEVDA